MTGPTTITVEVSVHCDLDHAWRAFTEPEAIRRWNSAGDGWVCPRASNDLRVGGAFNYRMESGDGKAGFDFGGEYTRVEPPRRIDYRLGDGRGVTVEFEAGAGYTKVTERFEAETVLPPEAQKAGWQAILDNYKRHAEATAAR